MNERRRESLRKSISGLQSLRDSVEAVADDEENSMLNIPESLQSSERFQQMENAVDDLRDAIDAMDGVIEKIEGVIG